MSKSIYSQSRSGLSKAVHRQSFRRSDAGRAHGLRGALVLLAAATLLVAGTYFLVLALTGPDGWVTHMASAASADVEGRTLAVAADNY